MRGTRTNSRPSGAAFCVRRAPTGFETEMRRERCERKPAGGRFSIGGGLEGVDRRSTTGRRVLLGANSPPSSPPLLFYFEPSGSLSLLPPELESPTRLGGPREFKTSISNLWRSRISKYIFLLGNTAYMLYFLPLNGRTSGWRILKERIPR